MSVTSGSPPAEALTACDREPIHRLGTLQPHGFLVALRGTDRRIVQASANIPRGTDRHLGRRFGDVFPDLDGLLPSDLGEPERDGAQYLRTVTLTTPEGPLAYDLAIHLSGGLTILEFEAVESALASEHSLDALYPRLSRFVEGLHDAASVAELCHLAAVDIRHITGFDRALVYRFDRD